MAIINNTFSFIFIHVPKAAGTSVTNAFSAYTNYCDLEVGGTAFGERLQPIYRNRFGIYKHIPARELKNIIGSKDWSRYFKFSIVRHPADRLLSIFNFLKQWEGTPIPLKEKLETFDSFESFVLSEIWKSRPGPDNIFFPQCHWLCDGDNLLVDYVGKLESLKESITEIIELASLPKSKFTGVERLNASSGGKHYDNISLKSKRLINEFYKSDFEIFNYGQL